MWFVWIMQVVQWGRYTRATEVKAWDEALTVLGCGWQVRKRHACQAEALGRPGSWGASEELPAVALAFSLGSLAGLIVTASH